MTTYADRREYPPHCQMMRAALREKNFTQDVVAWVMEQSLSTVNAILSGRRELTGRLAIDYGHLLSLNPTELLRAQGAWQLELMKSDPKMQRETAAIRLRVKETDARIRGDWQSEIESLEQQKQAIQQRLDHLRRLASSTTRVPDIAS